MNTNHATNDKSAFHAKCAVITVCLCYVISTGIAWNTFTVYAESVIAEFGIMRAQFTMNMTIFSAVNAVVTLFLLGPLCNKFGATKMVKVFPWIGCLGFAIIAISKSITVMYLGGVLFGASACFMGGNVNMLLINAWYKKGAGTMMGIPQTVGSITGIIMSTVYGFLVAQLGWRIPNWITAAVFAAIGIIIALTYKGSPEELGEKPIGADEIDEAELAAAEAANNEGVSFKQTLRHPQYRMLCIVAFTVAITTYGVFGNLTLLSGDAGHAELAPTVLSVALIASAIFFVPAGKIIDKFGTQWLIGGSMAVLIIAIIVLRLGNLPVALLYVIAALVGASYDCAILSPGLTIKQAFGNRDAASKLAIVNAFNFTGLALGPTVLALFYDMTGSYGMGWTTYIVLSVLTAVLVFLGVRKVTPND